VIFLGDFIDRGRRFRQVLEIVRPMIEEGSALSVMGNHELNALAYHTEDPECRGEFLRRHFRRNEKAARRNLTSTEAGRASLLSGLVSDAADVVGHGWPTGRFTPAGTGKSINKINDALEEQGGISRPYCSLPAETTKRYSLQSRSVFKARRRRCRRQILLRQRWKQTHRRSVPLVLVAARPNLSQLRPSVDEIECDLELDEAVIEEADPYPNDRQAGVRRPLLVFGTATEILAENVACVDYSVQRVGFCALPMEVSRS